MMAASVPGYGSTCDELIEQCLGAVLATFDQFPIDYFAYMVRHTNVSPHKCQKLIRESMQNVLRRDLGKSITELGLPESLDALRKANSEAWDRRARSLEAELPNTEKPIELWNLSIKELSDCRLKSAREQWLAELVTRRAQAQDHFDSVVRKLSESRLNLRAKFEQIEDRLGELMEMNENLCLPTDKEAVKAEASDHALNSGDEKVTLDTQLKKLS